MQHPTSAARTTTPPPSEACGTVALCAPWRLRIGDALDPEPTAALEHMIGAMRLAIMGSTVNSGHELTGRPTLYVGDADRLATLGCPPPPIPGVAVWLLMVQPMTCPTAVRP